MFLLGEAEHMMGTAVPVEAMAADAEGQALISDEPLHDGVVAADICGFRERDLMGPTMVDHAAAEFASPLQCCPASSTVLPASLPAAMGENEGGTYWRPWQEDEVAREWEWLNEAINRVARARAEDETDNAFRLLQQQAVAVGQRRVELRLRMAALEGQR